MQVFYDQYGIARKWADLMASKHLADMKRENGSNPWPVIEECIKIWMEKKPKEWKAYLVDLGNIKQTRRDSRFATSETEKFRYTLDVPQTVLEMIRCVYSPDELPMKREFFRAFAKKFPKMMVADKI